MSSNVRPSAAPPRYANQQWTPEQIMELKAQKLAADYLTRGLCMPPHLERLLSVMAKEPVGQAPPLYMKLIAITPDLNPSNMAKDITQGVQASVSKRTMELNCMLDVLKEIRMNMLLPLQRKARAELLQEYHQQKELVNPEDRMIMRRPVKLMTKEPVASDIMQNVADRNHRRAKEQEHLRQILEHAARFRQKHADRKKEIAKLAKALTNHWLNRQRAEQIAKERAEKDRLKALRNNDEDAYFKLLEETKDARLKTLYNQTGEYLDKLAESIEALKEATAERRRQELDGTTLKTGVKVVDMDTDDKVLTKLTEVAKPKAADADGIALNRGERYMKVTHSVIEEVTKQPEMLKGGKLKSYQLVGLRWLVSLYNNGLNGVLADEMGLGKTIQTIGLLAYLMESKNNKGPFLVGCPLSTMMNWRDEFGKWAPDMRVVVYRGDPKQRKDIYHHDLAEGKFNVVLTTYEYFLKDKSVLAKIQWQYIIIDEGHRIKNHNSKLSTTLAEHYKSHHRLLLTGTPLQNNIPELWSLLNFLLPSVFNSCDTFEQWFNAPFANTGGSVELNEEETLLLINRLHKLLRPFLLRRLKKDVESELPDKTEKILRVQLSSVQKLLYEKVQARSTSMLGGLKIQAVNNIVMQLRKVCNHPYLFPEMDKPEEPIDTLIRISGKFALLDNILAKLKQTGHRVLMFCQMTNLMTILEDMLTYRGYKYLRLDGGTKAETRGELLTQFNDPQSEHFLFLLSTRAGGLGLNLQSADTVVIFDSDWNPHADLQAQDRAHRIGQKHEVRVIRLVTASPVENAILERATHKLTMDAKVIQAGLFNTTSTAEDRRSMLETLVRLKPSDKGSDVATAEEINNILARSDDEFDLFQNIDSEMAAQRQRAWTESGHEGRAPPPLMVDDEFPAWMNVTLRDAAEGDDGDGGDADEEKTPELGRGHRRKSSVFYDDGLTELQWMRIMDKGGDLTGAIEKKREARATPKVRRKRTVFEEGGDRVDGDDEQENSDDMKIVVADNDEQVDEHSELPPIPLVTPTPTPRSRSRGKKIKAVATPEPQEEQEHEDLAIKVLDVKEEQETEKLVKSAKKSRSTPSRRRKREVQVKSEDDSDDDDDEQVIKRPSRNRSVRFVVEKLDDDDDE